MTTLAVDPVLLYAKLEVAKLEQDASRRAHHERKQARAAKEAEAAFERAAAKESRRHLRASLHGLPLEGEYMADGKPCINTAQLLAALESNSPPLRHGSMRKSGLSRDVLKEKEDSSAASTDNDAVEGTARRRRFKAEEGPFKLVPIKHGSQTTYERVDLPPDTGLIEDSEDYKEDETFTRPKLSKYDRPHWAQQSQNATQMRSLKSTLTNSKNRRSEIPPLPADGPKFVRRSSANAGPGKRASDTLIAEAVSQIKKEQRTKKLHTVSSLFKKTPAT